MSGNPRIKHVQETSSTSSLHIRRSAYLAPQTGRQFLIRFQVLGLCKVAENLIPQGTFYAVMFNLYYKLVHGKKT